MFEKRIQRKRNKGKDNLFSDYERKETRRLRKVKKKGKRERNSNIKKEK